MKRVLILCNGRPPGEDLFHKCRAKSDYFIAADGGGNIARAFDAQPDIVIGDLDSFEPATGDSFQVISRPGQESNDLEKAISRAREQGGTHLLILGATGYRLDHTLKNLSVLVQFDDDFEELVVEDDFGTTRILDKSFQTELPVGTQLSLFPLSGKVTAISTEGLKYPLNKESLENGVRDGSSNEVISNPVKITHQKGDLLLYTARNANNK